MWLGVNMTSILSTKRSSKEKSIFGFFTIKTMKIVAALTTEFAYYPLRVNLSVSFLGSDDSSFTQQDWVNALDPLEEFGKIHGCSALEFTGRRAWARLFKDSGFVETFTTVEREITHGEEVT